MIQGKASIRGGKELEQNEQVLLQKARHSSHSIVA